MRPHRVPDRAASRPARMFDRCARPPRRPSRRGRDTPSPARHPALTKDGRDYPHILTWVPVEQNVEGIPLWRGRSGAGRVTV